MSVRLSSLPLRDDFTVDRPCHILVILQLFPFLFLFKGSIEVILYVFEPFLVLPPVVVLA